MNWKNLWNKKYALGVFYLLLLALLYQLGIRFLDNFSRLGGHLATLFPWASQVFSPLFLGFAIAYSGETVATTSAEQRATDWIDRYSLADFMNADFSATIENLPPPQRVIIIAMKGRG